MNRRMMLTAAALAFATPALAGRERLRGAARDAYVFSLPLVEIARTRYARFETVGINRLVHGRRLLDHTARSVTTPNNDTLYSTAQLDLTRGAVTIAVPPAGERYLSVALMDAYSNNFAVLGARLTPEGGVFTIAGPGTAAPAGAIVSPTNHVWCLGRVLVTSPEDVPAAIAVAQRISLSAPADAPPPIPVPDRDAPWAEYLAAVDRLMALNPPFRRDGALMRRIALLGLGRTFDPARFGAAAAAEIEAGLAEGRAAVRSGFTGGDYVSGWSYAKGNIGDFGTDYGYRGAVALSGLAALPAAEALYMRAAGDGGGVFLPGPAWRLHFPAGAAPPVDGFWSMSLYEQTPAGQYFFAANPIGRYAIGDRTPGLRTNPDGSLDIWISHEHAGSEREPNWLPASPKPFAVVMRAYLPRAELREGRYRLPPLVRI